MKTHWHIPKLHGGFNLQEVLGWSDDKYKNFMVSYASLLTTSTQSKKAMDRRWNDVEAEPQQAIQQAEARSNPGPNRTSKSGVDVKAMSLTFMKGTKKFKIVDRYEMNWPIREALKGRLKNTSNRAKRKVQRQTDQKIQKVWVVDHLDIYAPSLTDL